MTLMRTIDNGVVLYSSPEELPIDRYVKFQKYLIKEASVESFASKLDRVKAFIEERDFDSAKVETNNAILCLNSINNGIDYGSMAFACLVYKIGEKVVLDTSDSGLSLVVDQLTKLGLSKKEVKDEVSILKKKSSIRFKNIFQTISKKLQTLRHTST